VATDGWCDLQAVRLHVWMLRLKNSIIRSWSNSPHYQPPQSTWVSEESCLVVVQDQQALQSVLTALGESVKCFLAVTCTSSTRLVLTRELSKSLLCMVCMLLVHDSS
jgi:hypothetical protein